MPIPIFPLCLTSHFVCGKSFQIMNIDVPASGGAPPFDPWLLITLRLRILMLKYWRWPSITSPPGLIMECPSLPLLSLPSSVEYRRDTTRTMATPCWCTAVLVWVGQAPSSCWIACWREWKRKRRSMCTSFYLIWGLRGLWWYNHK